jgi:SAM-dependent methyltransferase
MASITDERGYNQGFKLVKSTEVRMRRRAEAFVKDMDLALPKEILEIGCGTGEIAFWVAQQTGANVLATDLSLQFIESAKSRYKLSNLRYEILDFNKHSDLPVGTFDYIVGNGILHHLYFSLDEALRNLKRLLKPGGSILFYEPNVYNPYCAVIFNVPFLRLKAHLEPTEMAFSRRYIEKVLQRAGFINVFVEYRDFLLPGVPEFLINPLIVLGNVVERIPILRMSSQSLYIKARNQSSQETSIPKSNVER